MIVRMIEEDGSISHMNQVEKHLRTVAVADCDNCKEKLQNEGYEIKIWMVTCPRCSYALFWQKLSPAGLVERERQKERRLKKKRVQELANIASDNGFYNLMSRKK